MEKEAGDAFGPVGRLCAGVIWPKLSHFFAPKYVDAETEEAYQKEVSLRFGEGGGGADFSRRSPLQLWWTAKRGYIYGCVFYLINWCLSVGLVARPWSVWLDVANYGLGPLFCLPLLPLVAFDWPRKHPRIFGIWLWLAVWYSSMTQIIDMKLCGYYSGGNCGRRDFAAIFFYGTAPPAVALFALGQSRLAALFGFAVWIGFACGAVVAQRTSYIRNLINLIIFYAFLLIVSYQRDIMDRKLYTMRSELKVQYRAKQRAEINERKSQDSRRRFSNYIFHEVRVPLNTALLAVQNLQGSEAFDHKSESAIEYAALEGSLQMMSQVLNDVLDFNRMERGGFSSVSRPFSLHNVIRAICTPVEMESNARGLGFSAHLDPRVDEVAKRAAGAIGEDEGLVEEGAGLVMGDEMRLRQVLTNLTSNATKFTQPGGKVSIRTSLIYPLKPSPSSDIETAVGDDSTTLGGNDASSPTSPRLSHGRLQRHNSVSAHSARASSAGGHRSRPTTAHDDSPNGPSNGSTMVVRFEIEDTGVGIKASDMQESRLFSPYVQTDIGRKQGGKGTGLGLSLVRQIVLLSGGRLGVKSKFGEGSIFWVELPFQVGPQTAELSSLEGHRRVSSSILGAKSTTDAPHFTAPFTTTPSSAFSEGSEYSFKPPLILAKQNSDFSLTKIDERHVTVEMVPSPGPSSMGAVSPPLSFVQGSPASALTVPLRSPPIPSPPMTAPPPPSPATTALGIATAPTLVSPRKGSASSSLGSKSLDFENGPLHVLVVDDDTLTRKLMARLLQRLGCIVDSAENGAIAIEKIVARKGTPEEPLFGVVFLDNQMPVCSGLDAVRKLRTLGRQELIVGATANALLDDQNDFLAHGADAVLTKPILEADLRRYCLLGDRRQTLSRRSSTTTTSSPPTSPPLLSLPQSPAQALLAPRT
ncbi:hypothetical protein BCR35DRAFT_29860 [Leucosporidium creatinivorum]|uniref:histidine kinase n=1 Tax=Leucosporidium creatinivorum TaxID=106004 RepID=A0A1Y2FZG5_9BASI|nr:hypothetical protein BCR35DRAFT_29860 [Leucosporidium creatinivorum]